jgi:hypothetical protein
MKLLSITLVRRSRNEPNDLISETLGMVMALRDTASVIGRISRNSNTTQSHHRHLWSYPSIPTTASGHGTNADR